MMFADADLDIKKRSKQDTTCANMLDLSSQGFWEEHFDLCASIFNERGIPKNDHLEMSKSDFVNMLRESDILIKPKVVKAEEGKDDKKKGEKKEEGKEVAAAPARKFEDSDAHEAIGASFAFDEDCLAYVDFLEALTRITMAYPFTDEELADLVSFEIKVEFLLKKMEAKFKGLKNAWVKKMNHPTGDDLRYQPRVVVDEDDEDDFMDN
jgi:hypothetical protein